jgi:hypothetical protein
MFTVIFSSVLELKLLPHKIAQVDTLSAIARIWTRSNSWYKVGYNACRAKLKVTSSFFFTALHTRRVYLRQSMKLFQTTALKIGSATNCPFLNCPLSSITLSLYLG